MEITIREFSNWDWEAVCDVHDRARPYEVGSFVSVNQIQPMSEVAHEDGFFNGKQYVACIEERVVGFICINKEELTWLYVDPNYHRQGIGKRLVEQVRSQLIPHGFVTTALENERGVKFYERMGFHICATFPGSCQDYPCTCVRLTLPSSRHNDRVPQPTKGSLLLAGYDGKDWGVPYRDEDGIWRWKPSQHWPTG